MKKKRMRILLILLVLLFCFAPMDSGWKAAEERTKADGEKDLPAFVLH